MSSVTRVKFAGNFVHFVRLQAVAVVLLFQSPKAYTYGDTAQPKTTSPQKKITNFLTYFFNTMSEDPLRHILRYI